jgi:streptogramin lyase
MKQNVILLFFILITGVLFSQTQVQEEWINTIQDMSGLDIELDDYDNVYVLTTNCTIIKYDSNGIEQWTVTYEDSTGSEHAVDLEVDNSNNIYFTGYKPGNERAYNIFTIKYDSDGNQLWETVYQTPSWATTSEPIGIATDLYGNVYVSGFSYYWWHIGNNNYCICVTIKYSSDGTEEWISYYYPIYDNWIEPSGIVVDNLGSVYITGSDGTLPWNVLNFYNFVTIKYDLNGIMQWDAVYSGPSDWSAANAINVDNEGNVYVTGNIYNNSITCFNYLTIKYNGNGSQLWVAHSEESTFFEDPVAIVVDNEGNVIVTGESDGFKTIKYDHLGVEQWVVNYVASSSDNPFDLELDQEGCIYITGRSNSDYATIKYNPDGSQEWLMQYNGVENHSDYSKAITLDSSGNVYITGKCGLENYGISCVTIKYSQSTYTNDEDVIFPKILLSNYPNPFNPSTTISFTAEDAKNAEISIYNLKGQKVKQFSDIRNQTSVIWNGTDKNNQPVSSGIYFYKLKAGKDFSETKRMLLLK